MKLPFKKIRSLQPWFILALFLLVWWILPPIFKSFTRSTFFEFQAPIWESTSRIKDLETFWSLRNHSKKELIEANRDLARLNSSYELTASENKSLKAEINRLEKLLDLPAVPNHQVALARISRRDLDSWCHQILIQKGSKQGIPVGAAVIYRGGVVGRVKEVHKNTSIVELVSSPTFRVAAHFIGDNRPITYQGLPNPAFTQPKGIAANIPTDFNTSNNVSLDLVSSRLGGVFPDGLHIGRIKKLEPGTDGLFQRGLVELSPELHRLQEVAVLIPPS